MLALVDGEYHFAKQLALIAHTFGFDGWLLNIEKQFPENSQTLPKRLTNFITSLVHSLGQERSIIWYDALNIDNQVKFQNGLTVKNLDYARAGGALFTNYKWTEARLQETRDLVLRNEMKASNVYFGIDVWAQNTNMPGPPRVTFPPKNGGGTNTGLV